MTWTTTMIKSLEHLTNKEAAEKYGLTITAVSCARYRNGIKCKKRSYRKPNPGRRRFFAEDIARIFELRCDGKTWAQIGDIVGMCHRQARQLAHYAADRGFDGYPPVNSVNE